MGVRMTSELLPVEVTEKSIISGVSGDVLHALKESDRTFKRFGEAYFSTIICGQVKGWKRHRLMTLNLLCLLVRLCSQYLTIEDKIKKQISHNIHCQEKITAV